MSKNQCRLDYCPYAELIGEYASCTACSWASYEDEKDAEDMTKEEAIKILEEEAEFLYGAPLPGDEPYNKTAFDMAIEALQFVKHFDLLKEFQSLQEVVRCKDCRYNLGETTRGESVLCNYSTHGMLIERSNEWFCADGERKEE